MKRFGGPGPPKETALYPGDEQLKWYSSEELFQKGLTRGQLDRLVLTHSVRWTRGDSLLSFLKTLGLVPDPPVGLNAIYYQVGEEFFVDTSPEGEAVRAALNAMGVQRGARCTTCQQLFPENLLLPDQYQRLYCAGCVNAAR